MLLTDLAATKAIRGKTALLRETTSQAREMLLPALPENGFCRRLEDGFFGVVVAVAVALIIWSVFKEC